MLRLTSPRDGHLRGADHRLLDLPRGCVLCNQVHELRAARCQRQVVRTVEMRAWDSLTGLPAAV